MSTADHRTPAGFHEPFATVSEDDHAAWILIAAALGLVYSVLFACMRAFMRWTTGRGRIGPDDVVLAVSTLLGVVQSIVVLDACSKGLGKSMQLISPALHDSVQQMYYGSNLLFVLAVGGTKISVILFLVALTATPQQRKIFHGAAATVGVWMIASFLALSLQCDLSSPWLLVDQECPGVLARWHAICVFSIIIELGIVGLAVYLVWSVQFSRAKKWTVVSAFAFRLLIIVPIALRLSTFDAPGYTRDPTLLEDSFLVWTQVELHYSLISATIPVLRPVINNLNTNYGALNPGELRDYAAGSGRGQTTHTSSKGAYELSDLKNVLNSTAAGVKGSRASQYGNSAAAAAGPALKPRGSEGGGVVRRAGGETTSLGSNDSEQMIIKKQMSWRVETETT